MKAPARSALAALVAAAALLGAGLAPAQQAVPAQSAAPAQIVTLDQERLFAESLYGQRVLEELEAQSSELAALNLELTAQLTDEERDLTEKRKTLPPAEFRMLADAFDEKVTSMREGQDARIRILQRNRDQARTEFNARIVPVLTDLVIESGAVAILDERAVILASDRIDITDRAIARIDALLGDGGSLVPGTEAPEETTAPDTPPAEGAAPAPGTALPE
ncbi:OmpH family outer membrane protein [Tropicimonas sp.]|uniref:OmpH family outer membrane protein n=1 Tax=Tropicimonas sp. TaxID=2067044 RepID=UPI003A8BC174